MTRSAFIGTPAPAALPSCAYSSARVRELNALEDRAAALGYKVRAMTPWGGSPADGVVLFPDSKADRRGVIAFANASQADEWLTANAWRASHPRATYRDDEEEAARASLAAILADLG